MKGLMVFYTLKAVSHIQTEKDKEIKMSQYFFFLICACV